MQGAALIVCCSPRERLAGFKPFPEYFDSYLQAANPSLALSLLNLLVGIFYGRLQPTMSGQLRNC